MSSHRLPPQPGEAIDRSTAINFTWNGQPVTGFAGDTIASALAAQGVDVFSRSMKYHRHRGIMTADHWDPNLSLQVGDEPNVRAGTRLLEEGMQVSTQNVWPSLKHDVGVLNKVVGRFLSAGFYYKTFMKPKFLCTTFISLSCASSPLAAECIGKPAPTGPTTSDTPTPTCW